MNTGNDRWPMSRRRALGLLGVGLAAGGCARQPSADARVVVVGGGFAGASCARAMKAENPALSVTLVEPKTTYTACPMSNLVIAGDRPIAAQQFGYDGLRHAGIQLRHQAAAGVDPVAHQVTLADGSTLSYERLVMAPGIELDWQALPGYDQDAARILPHAWQAGEQTLLLRQQLHDMADGGLVVMSVPANPYRCPPGPYERASLIASYLRRHKPRSKMLILDGKDQFSKQDLFMQAWQALYPGMIEWQGLSDGAQVRAVDAPSRTLHTDFESVQSDVANVIPPQRAGAIARQAGVTDASGWCPIDPLTFASTLQPDIHVIGDAAIANAMPKSAFAANVQASYCAVQIVRALAGLPPQASTLINTCYSLAAPDYAFSIAGVYRPAESGWLTVTGAGGTSALEADAATRRLEAVYARSWFGTITTRVFGS